MQRIFEFMLLIAVFALVSPACAKFEVIAQSPYDDDHPFHLGMTNWCEDFPEDAYTLIVREDGKLLASLRYCAVYGRTEARGFIDRSGRRYAFVRYDVNHGSSVMDVSLHVYEVVSERLREVVVIPIEWSQPCGWVNYDYVVRDTRSGIKLVLDLKEEAPPPDYTCPLGASPPAVKKRVIEINTPR